MYAERKAKTARKDHKKAVNAVKKHKGAKFTRDEEADAQAAFNKYKRKLWFLGMIFTVQCFMTIKDLDEALKDISETKKL